RHCQVRVYVFAKDGKKLNFFASWGIAQVVTVESGVLSYPWETVRRRLMMQSDGKKLLYKNTLGCAIRIIKNKGMPAMFKIASPRPDGYLTTDGITAKGSTIVPHPRAP
ncbi:hypothetical protein PFISCL1PPCAC_19001, partial [Pristionchus fissidentatus]